jgi:hypothetical protein
MLCAIMGWLLLTAPLCLLCFPARRSQAEQTEVENAFLKMGVLLPNYHKNYWMGLNTTIWPLFYWVDPLVPQTDSPKAYNNWAIGEPNNMNAPEFCGGADLTRTRLGAAGWADLNCMNANVYICKISGGPQRCHGIRG